MFFCWTDLNQQIALYKRTPLGRRPPLDPPTLAAATYPSLLLASRAMLRPPQAWRVPLSCTISSRARRCGLAALLLAQSLVMLIAISSTRLRVRTESKAVWACPISFLPVDKAVEEMSRVGAPDNGSLRNLTYVTNQTTVVPALGNIVGSEFGGFPTLVERLSSFIVKESMHVHCGFVKGPPGVNTGFDIGTEDLKDMEACTGVLVATAIFGNYDELWQPTRIGNHSVDNVCFFAFLDEYTACSRSTDGSLKSVKKIGLWRVVVVRNLPYKDTRRVGEIPKQLLHRLFPNVEYSIWQDAKVQLSADPYQVLERYLWRSGDVLAISSHPQWVDSYDEAEATKDEHRGVVEEVDAQMLFYRQEGWPRYSTTKLPISSDVPDSCVVIRRHTPLTNLFSCLWFNELNRFTPRDQLCFGIIRDKLMFQSPLRVNMFKACELLNFGEQRQHRCKPNGPCLDGKPCTA